MVRYSFLVRLFHPLLHAGLSRRILNHLIRPRQHVRRNREADLLSRFQVDEQLKLRRLLYGNIGWLSSYPFVLFPNLKSKIGNLKSKGPLVRLAHRAPDQSAHDGALVEF